MLKRIVLESLGSLAPLRETRGETVLIMGNFSHSFALSIFNTETTMFAHSLKELNNRTSVAWTQKPIEN